MKIYPNHGSDEMCIDGQAIHESWSIAWPKAIARAWEYELSNSEKIDKVENYYGNLAKIIPDTLKKDTEKLLKKLKDEWHHLSRDMKEKIDKILKNGGLTILEKNIDIVGGEILEVIYRMGFCDWLGKNNFEITEESIWYSKLLSKNSNCVLHALMNVGFIWDAAEYPAIDFEKNMSTLLIVRKPGEEYNIEGYDNIDKCKYEKTDKRTDRISISYFNDGNDVKQIIRKNKGPFQNGWGESECLEHVLVLTLPPRPADVKHFAMAVTDYVAEGRIYPFTSC